MSVCHASFFPFYPHAPTRCFAGAVLGETLRLSYGPVVLTMAALCCEDKNPSKTDAPRYLAEELGERKIAVNVVAPGGIETDFGGGALRDIPEVNAFIASQTALGRAGVPDDIGPVIAALLSPSHRWINAQRIEVSGGWVL